MTAGMEEGFRRNRRERTGFLNGYGLLTFSYAVAVQCGEPGDGTSSQKSFR